MTITSEDVNLETMLMSSRPPVFAVCLKRELLRSGNELLHGGLFDSFHGSPGRMLPMFEFSSLLMMTEIKAKLELIQ